MSYRTIYGLAGVLAVFALGAVSSAAEIVLNPIADAFVSSVNPDMNYGAATAMTLTGTNTAGQHVNAGLFKFDLSELPAGATIDSVQFRIYVTAAGGNPFFEFFGLTEDWDESEVTWNHASAGTAWSTVGGSWAGAQLGNDDILAGEVGGYQVFPMTTDFLEEVQGWLDDPEGNFGIHLRRRFGDTDQFIALPTVDAEVNQPELFINYTPAAEPVPEPGSLGLIGAACLMLLARRRAIS